MDGLTLLFIVWLVCLFCWVSLCGVGLLWVLWACLIVGGCIVFNSVGRGVLRVLTFVVGG